MKLLKMLFKIAAVLAAAAVLLVVLCFAYFLFFDDEEDISTAKPSGAAAASIEQVDSDETWTICWYLCGSDLESDYGAASADIDEMLSANLSDKVQVIIQTGGAYEWTKDIDPDVIQRYRISTSGMELVDEQPQANMGDGDTLEEFLAFCKENYPADHTAVVFWNHGGGTVGGVAYDELYDYDSLSLTEIHDAFERVYDLSESDPPIDLIGFDACLMASIDTAATAGDIAEVMVASEESEPGVGWEYTGFLTGLSRNTGMDAATLGKLICDSYAEGCTAAEDDDEMTLSVVDLQKIGALTEVYNNAGIEALTSVCADSLYYTEFSRCADSSENYGGNGFLSGYTDMVDLSDLIRNSSELLPESAESVLNALEDCVLYQVVGEYRENASGLSCYHAYDGDYDTYQTYSESAASEAFNYFYAYGLTGEWSDAAAEYLSGEASESIDSGELPTEPETGTQPGAADSGELDDFAVYLDEDNTAILNLGSELAADLSTVLVHLAYVDDEGDVIYDLGSDSDLYGDWDTGVFSDNFWGTWGSIDGYLCYREVVYEADDYTLYSVPILLNGEECLLSVVYDYEDEEYDILGARRTTDEDTMGSKYLLQLNPGDEITTLHYSSSISGDDDFVQEEIVTFTVTEDTAFYDADMGEGEFILFFVMLDAQNNDFYSAPVYYTVDSDGEIYVSVD